MEHKIIPVLIFGSEGASKDVYCCIKAINKLKKQYDILGFVESEDKAIGKNVIDDVNIIASDNTIDSYLKKFLQVGVILPFGNPHLRMRIWEGLKHIENICYPNIIHPSVIRDEENGILGQGNIIGPGAVIVSKHILGNFNYVGANALLEHDICIGDFNSISPSVSVAGNVKIRNCCQVGIGASINQGLTLTENCIIGAGAAVIREIEEPGVFVGVPAKRIK